MGKPWIKLCGLCTACDKTKGLQRSQDHRKAEVGRQIWRSSSSQQFQLQQISQGYVLLDFGYLQGWRLCYLSGQPVTVSDHPHSRKKKLKRNFVPVFKWNFLDFILCPLSLVPSLGTTEKDPAPSSFLSGIYPDWWDFSEPSLL